MEWTQESEGSQRRRGAVQAFLRKRRVAPDTEVVQWGVPRYMMADSAGGRLLWYRYMPAGDPVLLRMAQPQPGMLREFAKLANASAEKIVAYAHLWGVLGVCQQHGQPGVHDAGGFVSGCVPPTLAGEALVQEDWALIARYGPPDAWAWERLESWRWFARHAQAMLAIGAALHHPTPVDERYWYDLSPPLPPFAASPPPTDDAQIALVLSARVTNWLTTAGVSPEYLWFGEKPLLRFQPHGLFGALGLALAVALAQQDRLVVCSHCRTEYSPERLPSAGRRNFCSDCREAGVDKEYAWKDRDARVRAAGGRKRARGRQQG